LTSEEIIGRGKNIARLLRQVDATHGGNIIDVIVIPAGKQTMQLICEAREGEDQTYFKESYFRLSLEEAAAD
jgi:hypothetical protein